MTFPPVPGAANNLNGLKLQATTPVDGFSLTDGTPTILTWTPPADGKLHMFIIFYVGDITSAPLDGGGLSASFALPDDAPGGYDLGGSGSQSTPGFDYTFYQTYNMTLIKGGTTLTVAQLNPVTEGAETVWVEIWGS